MNGQRLIDTARTMVASGRGLLALDESPDTCNQRFARAGIAQTMDMRRRYRELLLGTPGLRECISGVILHDETIRQTTTQGMPLSELAGEAGLLVGIKVDIGTKDLAACPGEKITEGLDGLRERLRSWIAMGARFAKWRAVIVADDSRLPLAVRPSRTCIEANAQVLARYAALCQEAGLVPVVEPEVLMDGTHTLARCAEVTEAVLRSVFDALALHRVLLEAIVLKPNMVLAGLACATQHTPQEVAQATIRSMLRVVPAAVPGIAFLSGGQSAELASSRLNAMHAGPATTGSPALPWPVTFSFARALQHPAMELWAAQDSNRAQAQQALLHRARCNRAALTGDYSAAMEQP
jgi:fructose-bisphosphate aldolase class I